MSNKEFKEHKMTLNGYLTQEVSGEIELYIPAIGYHIRLDLLRCNAILDEIRKLPNFDPTAYATFYSKAK